MDQNTDDNNDNFSEDVSDHSTESNSDDFTEYEDDGEGDHGDWREVWPAEEMLNKYCSTEAFQPQQLTVKSKTLSPMDLRRLLDRMSIMTTLARYAAVFEEGK